ncbi:MAG: LptF/LptG family permease [Brevundimonas sp.]|uniref:LptF/LptG family permease n=1 Tax=Brevundimonas sp. TaxID=1871086 RepID=UPI00271B8F50|nr:LptF/LptG family permease [Brevundimonas sp.]MDO9588078.1 LptF/LptG family permease [Brevundimonas sp.]MDP3368540.1 LptF/LptG family permease [Brevundimonas sp.]MDP3657322.1 LptF/LptG family permease [Brevundimonas sp.]MDZ4109094.1 LptF/LptG family permease [Brevundimonas sp.]
MTLIQGYLFRQIARPVVGACAALAGIGILSQSLDQLEIIVERGQSVWVMVKLTLLAVPQLLAVIIPIGLFVGALIALTRLQREQELTAIFASGVTRWSAIRPAVRLAAMAALLTLAVTTVGQPWAQRQARAEAFAVRTDLAALLVEEGRFVQGADGLTVYVQQIEQNGLLKNLFVYVQDGDEAVTWDAAEARFGRIDGVPVLTMLNASTTRYSSRGVLTYGSFERNVLDLSPFTEFTEQVRYKPSDLYLTQLFNPSPQDLERVGSAGELRAEAHSRLSAPLYALMAMAMALTAIIGGPFSRTGYGLRIARAAGVFLFVRIAGYGVVSASAWNGWLNVFQYLLPVLATGLALRLLFRALKPRRRRIWPAYERLKARFA